MSWWRPTSTTAPGNACVEIADSRRRLPREGSTRDDIEVIGWRLLGGGEAVVGEQHETGSAQPPRRLDVLDRLLGFQSIGADAGPHDLSARDVARCGDLNIQAARRLGTAG